MNFERIRYMRVLLLTETIGTAELSEIETAFEALDPATLSDLPENATASDMLDELESAASIPEKILNTAQELTEKTIWDVVSDRNDPYYSAMSSEWYDEQTAALRSSEWTVIDTPESIGLRFTRTGIIVANRRLESIMEAAVVNNLPAHLTDADPVVFTQTQLIFGK